MKDVRMLSTDEAIPGLDGRNFGDLWQWAYSDTLSNGNRSVFAEYIVGVALGVVDRPRREWNRSDLLYLGKEIEVKASAYVQAWLQKGPSSIKYDIAKKTGWDAITNISSREPVRSADCYVFCLHPEKEPDLCDICNVNKWEFYVVSTCRIEQAFGNQKTVTLSRLRRQTDPVSFTGLKNRVDEALGSRS